MPLIAVLSPAKTLDMTKTTCTLSSKASMQKQADELLPSLQKLSAADLKKMMGLSDSLAKLNLDRYKNFSKQAPKQAALAFDGPAYRGLSADDFNGTEQKFAQQTVRILCGLYGVLRPYDEIRPYRLEMGVKIATAKGKSLYDFWGDGITDFLDKELKGGDGPKILVNCASQEYWKSVSANKLSKDVKVITIDFPGPAVYAKKARGLMCRHIVKNRVKDLAGLKTFHGEGEDKYCLDTKKSSESKLVFTRGSGGGGKRKAEEKTESPSKRRK
eukprot:gnl/MRDRNA2_/MRDRNA2_105620_c0_seq1.p1 gnl/MRDRNA2_/MRDRNA2_105620_c0~~gnl/MRDRNA2_/MRDRNA2_105620_c0_seq1.p1  ORF type:complete len:272 (+),score=76.27 gnl/MRDRNA2_/MRDRNA2_105620_c0_seq1:64-879(+)